MGQMCISGSRGPPAVGSVQPRAAWALSWDSATWRPESHMPSCLADKDALNPWRWSIQAEFLLEKVHVAKHLGLAVRTGLRWADFQSDKGRSFLVPT